MREAASEGGFIPIEASEALLSFPHFFLPDRFSSFFLSSVFFEAEDRVCRFSSSVIVFIE